MKPSRATTFAKTTFIVHLYIGMWVCDHPRRKFIPKRRIHRLALCLLLHAQRFGSYSQSVAILFAISCGLLDLTWVKRIRVMIKAFAPVTSISLSSASFNDILARSEVSSSFNRWTEGVCMVVSKQDWQHDGSTDAKLYWGGTWIWR